MDKKEFVEKCDLLVNRFALACQQIPMTTVSIHSKTDHCCVIDVNSLVYGNDRFYVWLDENNEVQTGRH